MGVPKWKKPETAKKEEAKPVEPEKPVPKWKKPAAAKKEEPVPEPAAPEPPVEEAKPVVVDDSRLKAEPETEVKPAENTVETKEEQKEGNKEGEKKEEEEEEEDHNGMKAMAKEQQSKFSAMDEEFAAGASKLSALRAKMKALRMKHKAAADADAAAEGGRQG